jgi:hypothetical protein
MRKIVNGEEVTLTALEQSKIEAEWSFNASEAEENRWKEQRQDAYPPIRDQLDKIYHEGLAAWKAEIKAIKDQFPKPQE